MSCVKNLWDRDYRNWTAAGCPLPTMMNIERRKGKDVPVIKKALVELDGPIFKAYAAVRKQWAVLDCYRSPGPIQFKGPYSNAVNYLVAPPVLEDLVRETNEFEKFEESKSTQAMVFHRSINNLSELSAARIKDSIKIPETLENNSYALVGIKKYKPYTQLVKAKIDEQLPALKNHIKASYFVEIQDKLMLVNDHLHFDDPVLQTLNNQFQQFTPDIKPLKIGVIYLGQQSPGGNNVIDGLLRYQATRKHVTLIGFINGLKGLMNEHIVEINEESFKPFRNLGGYDYLGRSHDFLRSQKE
jgi:hypothetical protein